MQVRRDGELIVRIDEAADGPAGAVCRGGGPAIRFEGWLGLADAVEQALSPQTQAPPDREAGDD